MADTPQVERKLTSRQRRFIEFYLQCWNASEAARQAGFKGESNRIGSRLLTNVDIKAEIQERMAALTMSTDEVLFRLNQQAEAKIGDFIEFREVLERETLPAEDGEDETGQKVRIIREVVTIRQVMELNTEAIKARGHLIKEVGIGRYGPYIKVTDNQAALQLIGKAKRLFDEHVEHDGEVKLVWDIPMPPAK